MRWSYEQGSIVCIDRSEGKRQLELVSLGLVKDTFLGRLQKVLFVNFTCLPFSESQDLHAGQSPSSVCLVAR